MYIAHPWSYFWLAIEPFPFSAYIVDHLFVGGRGYIIKTFLQIDFSWFTCIVFFIRPTLCMFILSDLLSPKVSWSWFCRRHVGPSTGPGCSSYGPGTAGDELVHRWTWRWYRVVQSGREWYRMVQSGTAADDEWWSLGGIRPPAHTTASKNSQTNFGHHHIFA